MNEFEARLAATEEKLAGLTDVLQDLHAKVAAQQAALRTALAMNPVLRIAVREQVKKGEAMLLNVAAPDATVDAHMKAMRDLLTGLPPDD